MLTNDFFLTDDGFDVERLCRDVAICRFSLMGSAATLLREIDPALGATEKAFFQIAAMPPADRDYVLADPAFSCWLDATLMALTQMPGTEAKLRAQDAALPALMTRIRARRDDPALLRVGGTDILIQRAGLDPVIRAITPPTFDFDAVARENCGRDPVGEDSLPAFREMVTEAFDNIRACDPQRHAILRRLVRIVGYLPDGAFRSCSAARYQGVVYLAGREESMIDFEESIVHEAAHQLLYKIAELNPIAERAAAGQQFELPWSGSIRDLFGYYHAYFIYIQIVKYYDCRAPQAGEARHRTERIRHLIHRGLEMANRDIAQAPGLTPAGRSLFDALTVEVAALGAAPALQMA